MTNSPRLIRPIKPASLMHARRRCAACLIIESAVRNPCADVIWPTVLSRTNTSTLRSVLDSSNLDSKWNQFGSPVRRSDWVAMRNSRRRTSWVLTV